MKTKTLILWLLLFVTIPSFAYDFRSGDLCYNITSDSTVAVTSGDYSGLTSVIIPETVTYNGITYSVTSIGDMAFAGGSGLTSVTIPNSVTTIGWMAFDGCSGLTSITIPDGATTIGGQAFYYCSSLTSITIPNSVTSIGNYAFDDTPWYRNQPNGILYIGSVLYEYRGDMPQGTNVVIKNGIKTIAYNAFAFSDCTGLTSVIIPNSVTIIDEGAFQDCTGLTSVIIGNSVTNIEYTAFAGCSSLESVTCYAVEPPIAYASVDRDIYPDGFYQPTFNNVDISSIPLYVPAEAIDKYAMAEVWKEFKEILPISAMPVEADKPILEPDENNVTITWPAADDATSYTIKISKDEELVCTLIFDANGVLQSMRFAAPARYATQHTTQAQATGNGFRFVVEGLDNATTYTYSITATDKASTVLTTYTGTFTTKSPAGIEDILSTPSQPTARKMFRDGQVYIICGGKTYTLQGAEVK